MTSETGDSTWLRTDSTSTTHGGTNGARRRGPYPEPLKVQASQSPVHSHRQPRLPWVITFVALALLAAATGLTLSYVLVLHHDRQTEQRREQLQVQQGICALLDQFPPSAVLAGPRQRFHCGPGTPLSQLPPAVQQQLRGDAARPTAAPTSSTTRPPAGAVAPQAAVGSAPPSLGAAAAASAVPTEAPGPPRPSGASPSVPSAPSAPFPGPRDPLLCHLVPIACQSEEP